MLYLCCTAAVRMLYVSAVLLCNIVLAVDGYILKAIPAVSEGQVLLLLLLLLVPLPPTD